jgi:ATPase subunit of ABC transporter with duplicated ATPase domains
LSKFAEYDGYTAESRAGELLLGVGIPIEQHNGPMSEVAPGWKLRVLLVQALFANPDILLLDEPTNNLDINTIRWLEDMLNNRESTMIIISHDRHFLNQVCTHMADLDYGKITVYPATTTTSWKRRRRPANVSRTPMPRPRNASPNCRPSSAASRPTPPRPSRPPARMKLIDKLKPEDVKPSSRQYPWIRFEYDDKDKLHRQAVEVEGISFAFEGSARKIFNNLRLQYQRRRPHRHHRRERGRQDDAAALLMGDLAAAVRHHQVGGKGQARLLLRRTTPPCSSRHGSLTDWIAEYVRAGGYEGGDVETLIRGTLGRLLFSGDEVKKAVA